VQRPLDGVLAGLVAGDAAGDVGIAVTAGRAQQVEVLADVQLQAQLVPHRTDLAHVGAVEEQVGVDVGQVADEDRDTFAEPAGLPPPGTDAVALAELGVGRGLAPAGVRAVHDVVVDQREGMEQLERGSSVDDAGVERVAARADEAPVAEGGSEALAARVDQPLQRAQRRLEAAVEGLPTGQLGVEEPVDPLVDSGCHRREAGGRGGLDLHGWPHVTTT
jgi:hypothetical protein